MLDSLDRQPGIFVGLILARRKRYPYSSAERCVNRAGEKSLLFFKFTASTTAKAT